jgi:hypothetical protein
MTLSGVEFLRRFLLHVLPTGFVRIRYYGLFANRCRAENLERCRALIKVEPGATPASPPVPSTPSEPKPEAEERDRCPYCGVGRLQYVCEIAPISDADPPIEAPTARDTS